MANSNKVFTKSELPYSLTQIEVLEGTGINYFEAMNYSNNNTSLLIKSLALQLVLISGNPITETILLELHIRDVIRIVEIINSMISEL